MLNTMYRTVTCLAEKKDHLIPILGLFYWQHLVQWRSIAYPDLPAPTAHQPQCRDTTGTGPHTRTAESSVLRAATAPTAAARTPPVLAHTFKDELATDSRQLLAAVDQNVTSVLDRLAVLANTEAVHVNPNNYSNKFALPVPTAKVQRLIALAASPDLNARLPCVAAAWF